MELDRLGLQQLHLDQQALLKQNAEVKDLLEKLNSKDFKTVLPELFKVKADALPPVQIDGEVKAVVDGGSVTVLNLADLETYFMGLQLAVVEALSAPTRIAEDQTLPVSLDQIETVLSLLSTIADKDQTITVEQGEVRVAFPTRPQDAIPVRLVDAKGRNFYNASFSVTGGGGGGGATAVGSEYSPTAETYAVNASITGVTLLPANHNRKQLSIYNTSTSKLYVKLGEGVAVNNFSFILGQDDYYEPPVNYTGSVTGLWAEADGAAMLTEYL